MRAYRFNFRAWVPEEKRMVVATSYQYDHVKGFVETVHESLIQAHGRTYLVSYYENGQSFPESEELPGSGIVLMQSTGLTDKNGREVFEGDVVRFYDCPQPQRPEPRTFVVTWREGNFYGWHAGRIEREFVDVLTAWGEVIGNIYENPDLLERK